MKIIVNGKPHLPRPPCILQGVMLNVKEGGEMKIEIRVDKKYGLWLAKHLQKEHPKTRGKIKMKGGSKK